MSLLSTTSEGTSATLLPQVCPEECEDAVKAGDHVPQGNLRLADRAFQGGTSV